MEGFTSYYRLWRLNHYGEIARKNDNNRGGEKCCSHMPPFSFKMHRQFQTFKETNFLEKYEDLREQVMKLFWCVVLESKEEKNGMNKAGEKGGRLQNCRIAATNHNEPLIRKTPASADNCRRRRNRIARAGYAAVTAKG